MVARDGIEPPTPAFRRAAGNTTELRSKRERGLKLQDCVRGWWPGTGLNRRRRPFQGRALPLSYLASVQTFVAFSCVGFRQTGRGGQVHEQCAATTESVYQFRGSEASRGGAKIQFPAGAKANKLQGPPTPADPGIRPGRGGPPAGIVRRSGPSGDKSRRFQSGGVGWVLLGPFAVLPLRRLGLPWVRLRLRKVRRRRTPPWKPALRMPLIRPRMERHPRCAPFSISSPRARTCMYI